jgi:hypothetical protein
LRSLRWGPDALLEIPAGGERDHPARPGVEFALAPEPTIDDAPTIAFHRIDWSGRGSSRMPITPFHLGPGAALKSLLGRRMSFTTFGLANGLIDLEPIANFVLTGDPAHRFFHTLIGATLVVLVSVWPGRLLCEGLLRWWNSRLSPIQARYLSVAPAIGIGAAATGAALGAYSHVVLDSIMHVDVRAFAPFSDWNALQGLVSIEALQLGCVLAGLAGLTVLALPIVRRWMTSRRSAKTPHC